jgi:hypothetical protein
VFCIIVGSDHNFSKRVKHGSFIATRSIHIRNGRITMSESPLHLATANNLLTAARQGMPVYDRENKKVGKVRLVQFGDESEMDPIPKPEGFYKLPTEAQSQLAREGFVVLDSGWFSRSRYAAASQIDEVVNDSVMLNVDGNQLVSE